jgi:hypothetical protein
MVLDLGHFLGLIGLGCEKSNRSRSGATSEPFCATWVPSTSRSASWIRCVAEWLARIWCGIVVDRQLATAPGFRTPSETTLP